MCAMIATTVKTMKLVTKMLWNSRASDSVKPEAVVGRSVESDMSLTPQ
jgi:hypothetical protein